MHPAQLTRPALCARAAQVVVVTTSNRPPGELNRNKLQAADFETFLALLRARCRIFALDTADDYRRLHASTDAATERTVFTAKSNTGESKRLVVESPWSQFISECQRF
jgi:predicted ATPase|eukprot:COSAG01_NODE_7075_length_3364_cov_16.109648_2_plen_108_part_00